MNSSEANQLRDSFGKIVGCIQQGNPAEAEALARQILRVHPKEPNVLRVLGIALMRQGKFEEALKRLATAVKIAPEIADGHEQHGLALAALGRLNEAEDSLQTALRLDPNSESVHSKLAQAVRVHTLWIIETQHRRQYSFDFNCELLQHAWRPAKHGWIQSNVPGRTQKIDNQLL